MKKIIVLLVAGCLLSTAGMSQKTKDADTSGIVRDQNGHVVFDPRTDSLPLLADSTVFINNQDLAAFQKMLKVVMTDPAFKNAADPISQYELIIANTNNIFIGARNRWLLQHKIKKPVK